MEDKLPAPLGDLLRQKLVDSWQQPLPQLSRRDTWIPRIPGVALLGVRHARSAVGCRCCLWKTNVCAPTTQVWSCSTSSWRLTSSCLFLDEIQRIPVWEGFVRRVMDSEPIDVVVSGSSAQMLSRGIASNLRGRRRGLPAHHRRL